MKGNLDRILFIGLIRNLHAVVLEPAHAIQLTAVERSALLAGNNMHCVHIRIFFLPHGHPAVKGLALHPVKSLNAFRVTAQPVPHQFAVQAVASRRIGIAPCFGFR